METGFKDFGVKIYDLEGITGSMLGSFILFGVWDCLQLRKKEPVFILRVMLVGIQVWPLRLVSEVQTGSMRWVSICGSGRLNRRVTRREFSDSLFRFRV